MIIINNEAELWLEVLARLIRQRETGKPLKTLAEVVEDLGITAEELEKLKDVDIEIE